MSRFWPVREPGQAVYERLRAAALNGIPTVGRDARRFERGGLASLIAAPQAEPRFLAAPRPAWTPYEDPRLDTLAQVYDLLINAGHALNLEVAE